MPGESHAVKWRRPSRVGAGVVDLVAAVCWTMTGTAAAQTAPPYTRRALRPTLLGRRPVYGACGDAGKPGRCAYIWRWVYTTTTGGSGVRGPWGWVVFTTAFWCEQPLGWAGWLATNGPAGVSGDTAGAMSLAPMPPDPTAGATTMAGTMVRQRISRAVTYRRDNFASAMREVMWSSQSQKHAARGTVK